MMKDMVNKVLHEDDVWAKHIDHKCQKCEKCNCGKHLCKFQSIHLAMTPAKSTYSQGKLLLMQILTIIHPRKESRHSMYQHPNKKCLILELSDNHSIELNLNPKVLIQSQERKKQAILILADQCFVKLHMETILKTSPQKNKPLLKDVIK